MKNDEYDNFTFVLIDLFENMATFRLADATIDFPTLKTGRSFDVRFQFKTAIAKGVLVECIGPDENFVRIKLISK